MNRCGKRATTRALECLPSSTTSRRCQRPELISTAKLRGGVRVKGITQTTQQAISRIVAAGLEHGDSRATIAKQIEQEMQTTGIQGAYHRYPGVQYLTLTGHYDMMRKAGAAWKTWHVANMSSRQTLPQAPER